MSMSCVVVAMAVPGECLSACKMVERKEMCVCVCVCESDG